MTNEEAADKLQHWIDGDGPMNVEAVETAIAALRSPAPGAVAMLEAAAKVAEKGAVLGSKLMEDPAMVDAWMSGVVDTQVQTAAAIRALPAPEVPKAVQAMAWVIDQPDGSDLEAAIVQDFREWAKRVYGI